VAYTEAVDKVIYGPCDHLSVAGFVDLALAALDQAGLCKQEHDEVRVLLGKWGYGPDAEVDDGDDGESDAGGAS
jgi:hypothetical protein